MNGTTLGHYRVGEQLGRGGMGEVFLADDLSLDRKVALKFLPDAFAGDPERMARFEREAKVLASLNHPNIAAIHGLEQVEGKRFIVMELVEGESLAQRLSKGPLPVEEALGVCRQIAEGLEAAHEKGVIHRDLKPANVMISGGDKIKILDFGLAKALSAETQSVDASQSPTITEAMTQPGIVLGTAAYMSPEQAKGKTVEKRADIWAFGCILYECLTGKRAFEGETVTETLAAVLTRDPEWQKVPVKVRRLLQRCLERDPKKRLRDIGDAYALLESAPESAPVKRPWLAWVVAIVGILAALVLGVVYLDQTPVEAPETRLEVVTPQTSDPLSLSISPDGRLLVFVASAEGQSRLWLRPLDQIKAQPLAGTERATDPFWSPNSRSIGFFADAKLKRIDVASGPPQVLASAPNDGGGTWNRDGVIVFAPSFPSPLYRVPASGGDAVAITQLDPPRQTMACNPQFMPDGRHLLYFALGADQGIYLTSLDSAETKRLIGVELAGAYAPPGYLLFMRQGTLFAQRFDAASRQLNGDSVQVANPVAFASNALRGGFSISETGMLAYRTASGTDRHRLAWFDRSGKEVGTLGLPDENNLLNPELSPDGRRVAVERTIQGNTDVYLIDAARSVSSRFTFDAAGEHCPVWSPDGSRIIFTSNRKGSDNLYQKASSGAGSDELLLESSENKVTNAWSPDGRFLLYIQLDPKTGADLWVLPLFGERKPFPFVNTSFDEGNGQFSPDGRWVAYQSNESGRTEVYVKPFPGPGGQWQVSAAGGISARWRHDGKELFYIAPDGKLMAVPVQGTGQTLKAGAPVALFQTRIVGGGTLVGGQRQEYAVAPDGQRFLMNTIADESTPSPIIIVTNWAVGLKK
jgi:serine/threonine protein kinase/Tol biopolymer transport system component